MTPSRSDHCWGIYERDSDDLYLVLFETPGAVWADGQVEGPYFEHGAVSGNFVVAGAEAQMLWDSLKAEPTLDGLLARLREQGFDAVDTPASALSWAIRNWPETSLAAPRQPREDWT
jgi:hypothetical protein